MTCVTAVTDRQNVLMGGDSGGSSPQGDEIYTLENAKVFAADPFVVGFAGSYRLGQVLCYRTQLPAPPDVGLERFMATTFVDALRASLADAGIEPGLGKAGSMLVGVHGRIFGIGSELQVLHSALPYATIGGGRHHAHGALYALDRLGLDLGLERQAEIALRAAQSFTPSVREPFVYVRSG